MKTAIIALALLAGTANAQTSTYGGTVGTVISGAATVTSLTDSGSATIGTTLGVTGAATVGSLVDSGAASVAGALTGAGASFSSGVTFSSAAFVGVSISSAARGSAGSAVTATCPANSFAISGGCDCTVEVAETSKLNVPSPTTPGAVPVGWTCQSSGGTGGQCAAYAICSRLQ